MTSSILARKGSYEDPDRCLGLETIQFAVTGTRYEFVNHSNLQLATQSHSATQSGSDCCKESETTIVAENG